MKKGDSPLFALALSLLAAAQPAQNAQPTTGTASEHHRRGVDHHLRRSLDAASLEYAQALLLDPPRDPTGEELDIAKRFAPRIYTTPTEFFPLKDFAVVIHPDRRLVAYHFFWEDDIDFPEDNDPCDHELMWVEYSPDGRSLERIWTYFHGRILEGGEAALQEARRHGLRPRVNVQWGKHGSMPAGWEALTIRANDGDIERKYLTVDRPLTLREYNEATFRKLSTEGRRLIDNPLARRLGWPDRFLGTWESFSDFSRPIDTLPFLDRTKMIKISRWNSATIDQHFLTYNFRPKTEWPDSDDKPLGLSASLKTSSNEEVLLTIEVDDTAPADATPAVTAVAVEVDGLRTQEVLVVPGSGRGLYDALIGPLSAGDHTINVTGSSLWSPHPDVTVRAIRTKPIDRADDLIRFAPAIVLRADTVGTANDLPVLMYVERLEADSTLRYSAVFTNEDGGTDTPALFARWGRACDIEEIYKVQLDGASRPIDETFQGPEHEIRRFQGRRIGDHPILAVATRNNMVLDAGEDVATIRPVPIVVAPGVAPRESILDERPWLQRLTARELAAEKKPFDPRDFVYLDAKLELSDSAAAAWIEYPDGRRVSSDRGDERLTVTRSGWVRVAVPAARAVPVSSAGWNCVPLKGKTGPCEIEAKGIFRLSDDFRVERIDVKVSGIAGTHGRRIAADIRRGTVAHAPATAPDPARARHTRGRSPNQAGDVDGGRGLARVSRRLSPSNAASSHAR